MSVDCVSYVIYGFKLPYDRSIGITMSDDDFEKFNEMVVMDGMGGEYMVFGRKLWEVTPEDGGEMIEIDYDSLIPGSISYVYDFIKEFPELTIYHDVLKKASREGQFKVLCFNHYS